MNRSIQTPLAAFLLITLAVIPANAQHCFRGKPLPDCKTFWITEFGNSYRLDQPPRKYRNIGERFYFTLESGLMANLNPKSALGATFMLGAGDNGIRFGVKPRYRHWLNNSTSLDIGYGVLVAPRFPGLTSHIGLNFGDWLALTTHLEIIRLELMPFNRTQSRKTTADVAWYVGAKLGSYPGLIASIVGPIIVLIALMNSSIGLGN